MKTKQIKPIKAWAVIDSSNFICSIELCDKKPKRFNIGTWQFFIEDNSNYKIIPVIITPIIDKPKSLLGTSKMIIKKGKPVIVKK